MTIQIHESQPTEAAPEWPKVLRHKVTGSLYIYESDSFGFFISRIDIGRADRRLSDEKAFTPLTAPVTITITP